MVPYMVIFGVFNLPYKLQLGLFYALFAFFAIHKF
jgi:hypothetical protein